jgi:hypothetical protein
MAEKNDDESCETPEGIEQYSPGACTADDTQMPEGNARPRRSGRDVLKHFSSVAISGLSLSVVLTVCAAAGWPGAKFAAHDLWEHAWVIHPLVYALIGTVVCLAIAFQGASIMRILLDRLLAPLLDATSHILAFSFGAFVPLIAVGDALWLEASCRGVASVVFLEFWIGLFAALSIAGRFIIEDRKPNRAGAQPANATDAQVVVFFVLGVLLLWFTVVCLQMSGPTDKVIEGYLGPTVEATCHLINR